MPSDASHAPDKTSTDLAYEIMNAVGQGLVVSSFSERGWRFEYVNPAFSRLVGRPSEDLVGMSMDDLIHPEDLPRLRRARERRMTGETTSYEVRLVKPDGETIHVQITGAPRWRDGRFEGSIFVVTDLTDRIRSEQRAKASERRLAEIISFLPDPTFVIDKDGRVTAWNRAMEELTAVKAEDMLGKGDFEYAIPLYGIRRPILIDLVLSPNEQFEDMYGTIQRDGDTLIAETYIPSLGPEGSFLWGKASPLYDAEGKLVGAIESIRDITDRKRAEEALLESEVHLRDLNRQIEQILGATKTGLDIIDAEFNIRYIDPEWAKVYGDPKGRKCYEYFMGRTEVCPTCGIPRALETKEVVVAEEILVLEGNRPIQVTTIPFQDSNGEWLVAEVNVDITERKAAEQAIRESEEKYRNLVERANDGITIIQDGVVRFANHRLAEMWGGTVEEILGSPFTEYIHPSELLKVADRYHKRIAGEALPSIYETALRRRDGSKAYVELNAGRITFEGAPANLVIVRDITERKRAEEALIESRKRFQDIVENISDWIWEVDDKGRYTYVSPVVEEVLGYKPEEMLGRFFYEFFLPEDRLFLKEAALCVFSQQEIFKNFENRNLHKNGRVVVLETSGVPIIGEDGRLLGYRGADCDITERKMTETALKESLRFLQVLIDTIPNAIFYKDTNGIYQGCNSAFERFLGLSKEEIIGRSVYDLYPPDLADTYRRMDQALFDTPGEQIYEYSLMHADGSRHDVIFNKATYTDVDGKLAGLVGVVLDITERKRMEEALLASEERYRLFFKTSRDCVFITSKEERWIDFNDVAMELFGYDDQEEFLNLRIPDLYENPEDRGRHLRFIDEHGFSEDYPVNLRKKDGTIINALITAVAVRDKNGKIVYHQGSIRDVTDRKRVEEALRKTEQEKAAVLGSLKNVAVEYLDPQMRIIWVNTAVEKSLGLPMEELKGMYCFEILQGIKAPCPGCTAVKACETGQPQEGELVTPDGKTWISRSNPIMDADGRIAGVVHVAVNITERKLAVEARLAAEEKYRHLVENLYDVVFTLDSQGVFTYISPVVEQIFGYAADEVLGQQFVRFIFPEDLPDLVESFERSMRGQIESLEFRIVTKANQVRYVRASSRPLLKEGRISGLTGVLSDITERKMAEEALRVSEERYRTIFRNAPVGIFQTTLPGRFLSANPALANMFGFASPEEMIADITDLGTQLYARSEDRERLKRLIAKKGFVENFEVEGRKKDGQSIWVSINIHAVRDRNGTILYLEGTNIDITERKRAEEALRESEEKFRTLFNSASDAIFIHDLEGRIFEVNQAACDSLGYTRDELLRMTPKDLAPPEVAALVPGLFEEIIRIGYKVFKSAQIRRDGSIIPHEMNARLIDYLGTKAILNVARDITERKKAEVELHRRDSLLSSVAVAANELLASTDFNDSINCALEIIGLSVVADRVYIFENHDDPSTGEHLMSQRFEWSRETVKAQIDNPALKNLSYDRFLPIWYRKLSSGEVVRGLVKDRPASERAILELQGIRSILVVPIIINDHFWGCIGFDDCHSDRSWSESEASILLASGGSIGGLSCAIERRLPSAKLTPSLS